MPTARSRRPRICDASTQDGGASFLSGTRRSTARGISVPMLEFQGRRIHAVSSPGGGRSIRKDVTQMGTASPTNNFRPNHEVAVIRQQRDAIAGGLPKTRPAGSGVELRPRVKQHLPAADAPVHAVLMMVPILSGKCPLGPFLPSDVILHRREDLSPFLIGLRDPLPLNRCLMFRHDGPPRNDSYESPDQQQRCPDEDRADLNTGHVQPCPSRRSESEKVPDRYLVMLSCPAPSMT